MNIDWKVVSQSDGYKSLKAAYERDVQDAHKDAQRGHRPMRNKQEFRKKFDWVIARAIHYAYHKQTTVDDILNMWEAQRSWYWYLNFYQECNQPWLVKSEHVKPQSVRTYYKKSRWHKQDPEKATKYYFAEILRQQKEKSKRKGKKARWDKHIRDYKAYFKT